MKNVSGKINCIYNSGAFRRDDHKLRSWLFQRLKGHGRVSRSSLVSRSPPERKRRWWKRGRGGGGREGEEEVVRESWGQGEGRRERWTQWEGKGERIQQNIIEW